MKKQSTILSLALAALLLGAGSVCAAPAKAPEGMPTPPPHMMMDEEMGMGGPCPGLEKGPMGPGFGCPGKMMKAMPPELRAKYKAITEEFDGKTWALRDKLFVKKAQLRALEHASTPDLKAVTETAEQVVSLQGQLRKLQKDLSKKLHEEVFKAPAKAPEKDAKAAPKK